MTKDNGRLKDRIYREMQENDLFGLDLYTLQSKMFHVMKKSSVSRTKIRKALDVLLSEGKIFTEGVIVRDGVLALLGEFKKGKMGSGFITIVEDGKYKEYRVPKHFTKNASDKSTVEFVLENKGLKSEYARVTTITEQKEDIVQGTVVMQDEKLVFVADDGRFDKPILLNPNQFATMALGKRCAAKILFMEKDNAFAEISGKDFIFGDIDNAMSNVESLLMKHGIHREFSKEALEEAKNAPTKVTEESMKGAVDFRHIPFITIDPSTAKDIDDAVYGERMFDENGKLIGYRVMTAIADVSDQVRVGSALDKESAERGESSYPYGGAVHMLPDELSSGICSLNAGVDRMGMITIMEFDLKGKPLRYDVRRGVINSRHQHSYEIVSGIRNNDPKLLEEYGDQKELVDVLYEASAVIQRDAKHRKALKLKGYEPTIYVNETKDKVVDYVNENNVDSKPVIENFMVATNRAIAHMHKKLGVPCIYRVHDYPSEENMQKLLTQLYVLGLDIYALPDHSGYAKISEAIKGMPNERIMQNMLIKSMKRAEYSTNASIGHFALALLDYLHFTSPIRRRADLLVHRSTKKILKKINVPEGEFISDYLEKAKKEDPKYFEQAVNETVLHNEAYHINRCERENNDLEKESDEVSAALYMADHIGKIYNGYVLEIEKDYVNVVINDANDERHSDIITVKIPINQFDEKLYLDEYGTSAYKKGTKELKFELGSNIKFKITSSDPNLRIISATAKSAELNKQDNEQEEYAPELVLQPSKA